VPGGQPCWCSASTPRHAPQTKVTQQPSPPARPATPSAGQKGSVGFKQQQGSLPSRPHSTPTATRGIPYSFPSAATESPGSPFSEVTQTSRLSTSYSQLQRASQTDRIMSELTGEGNYRCLNLPRRASAARRRDTDSQHIAAWQAEHRPSPHHSESHSPALTIFTHPVRQTDACHSFVARAGRDGLVV